MNALYDRYAQAIFAYARLHTPSWEDAEDLTIEVFLVALEHRSSLLPLEQVVETLSQDEAQTPEQLILRREAVTQLYRAVEQLSVPQRQVLQLRIGDGLLFAEIAILLNKKEEAVRKLYSRALARLRTIYHQQEKGERAL